MSNKFRPDQEYKMPQPYRGQIVLWYESAVREDGRACPAIVKVDNHSSLHLHIYGLDQQFDITCVRHLDDPNTKEWDKLENGGWDFCKPDRVPGAFQTQNNVAKV